MLATTAIWGVAPVVIKLTLIGIPALSFLTYRFAISTVIAVFMLIKLRAVTKRITLSTGTELFFHGFLGSTVALGLFFIALEKTTVLDSTLIALVGPLMIVAAGVIFLKERVNRFEKIGMGIALAGTLVTIIQPLLESGGTSNQVSGNILVALYLVVNTITAVLLKKLMNKRLSPEFIIAWSFIIGFVTIAPIAVMQTGFVNLITSIATLPLKYHLGVWFMAVLSGSLAYTFWGKGQKDIEIGEAAIFSYLYPIFSTPLAIAWLGEKITVPFIVGAGLILTGVALAEYRKRR